MARLASGVLFAYALVLQMLLAVPLASRHDVSMELAAASALDEHALCLTGGDAPRPAGDAGHHDACCLAACAAGAFHVLLPPSAPPRAAEFRVVVADAPRPEGVTIVSGRAGRGPAPRAPPLPSA